MKKLELSIEWPTFEDLLKAYENCKIGKSASRHQTKFEMQLGKNILQLHREIHSGRYVPAKSICFVVTKPKPREVFAANFRDRIVHHLIVKQLEKLWQNRFSSKSFACRKGKGTHGALRELGAQVRTISQGGVKDVWVLHVDVASFFVTINRNILLSLLLQDPLPPMLKFLVENTYRHDARKNIYILNDEFRCKIIPTEKSWFSKPAHLGLPIGNLTSQFAANVYLTALDNFIQRTLRPQGYIRYMDDLLLMSSEKKSLAPLANKINSWLKENRAQQINPTKTKLIKLSRSKLKYLGLDCKQSFEAKKTIELFTRPLKKWEFVEALFYAEFFGYKDAIYSSPHALSVRRISKGTQAHIATLNSRLGSLKHTKSYSFRKKALMKFWDKLYQEKKEFLYFNEDFTAVALIKKHV